ncbi:MAG: hypothetical protein ACRD2A_12535, partial [Vicinamibacterales bacterium]
SGKALLQQVPALAWTGRRVEPTVVSGRVGAMFKLTFLRTLGLVCLVVIGVAGVVSGQDQMPGRSTLDRLLAEVQGLRSEVTHASGASIRAQLLVARLQLQEQRITNIARQLADVQGGLDSSDNTKSSVMARMKQIDELRDRQTGEQQEQLERETENLTAMVERESKRSRELRAQERELENLLADEQARWSEFNGRLDELELSLPR